MHDPGTNRSSHTDILKVVLIYAVFGSLWILFSDKIVVRLFDDPALHDVAQTIKGWLFIGITSLLLYLLLHRSFDRTSGGDEPIRRSGLVNWKLWQLYLFAAAITLITILIRENVGVPFGSRPLLILFVFPIILSAAIGGFGPGLLATLIATLYASYYFLPATGAFQINQANDLLPLGLLITEGMLVSLLSKMLHEARFQSEQERQKAEASLVEKTRAMQLLEGIAEGSTDAIFAKDRQGRYLLFNQAAARNVGKSGEEVLGMDDTAIFRPEDAALVMADDRRVMEENRVMTWEHRLTTSMGGRVFSTTQGPLHDENGNVTGLFGIAHDITVIKSAEEALRRERDRNQRYLDTIQNIMVALDSEGRITMLNRYGCELLGYRESELLGENWFRTCLPQPEGMETTYPVFRQIMSGHMENTEHFENRVLCRDGTQRMIAWRNNFLMNQAGNIVGTLSSGEDITEKKKAETALRQSELHLLLAQEGAHVGIWEWDVLTGRSYWSPEAERLYGFEPGTLHNNEDWRVHVHPDDLHLIDAEWERHILPGESFEVEFRYLLDSGEVRWLISKGRAQYDESGKPVRLSGINLDITARKTNEEQLRKLSLAVEQSPESIAITDIDGSIEYVNEAFVRNTGYSREEVIGQNPRVLHSGRTPRETYDALWKSLTEGRIWEGEFYNKRKDGSEYTEHAIISPIRQPDGRITHYLAVKEDITAKKRAEAEINRLAFYDTLTGLPNRTLLLERVTQTLALTRRTSHFSALISFNIDRFKTVNDAGGQELGDAMLKAVAERLCHTMREGDVVARIAGDEFGILLTDLAPQQQSAAHYALHVADKIHAALHKPVHIGNEHITLTACLGIAMFPEGDNDTPLDILRRANTALHHAKTRGSGQTSFFEGALDEVAKQRFDIERELHQAIKSGELRVFLQPQVDASGKTVGAEALVRWQHPLRGLIQPGAFIPIAEESNLIIEIGLWVFSEVSRLLIQETMSTSTMRISVNISPRHFRQNDFVDQIKRSIAHTGVDPTRLTLEVTEGMLIDNINDVIAKMVELSMMGIHFSLDDFGTGYSSLSYLKRLPIHEIKIDKTFVQDMTTDANDASLVETILLVAQHMHLKVVAEGVETEEQAAFLNERGPVIHQGYLFGRPEPAANMLASLLKQRVS
ncbi:MAG: PAS domain S-box protein [Nitrosomonadales bacterium]|nr:PAS domain S-box protein [Nitrosomonadales bacterium]